LAGSLIEHRSRYLFHGTFQQGKHAGRDTERVIPVSCIPRRSLLRSIRLVLSVTMVVAGMLFLLSTPLAQAACPPTDPQCIADEQLQPPSAPSVPGPVDDAVNSARDRVDNMVDRVTTTIDRLVDPGKDPGGGGGGGGGGPRTEPPVAPGRDAPAPGIPGTPAFVVSEAASPDAGPVRSTPVARRHEPGVLGRIGGLALETARQLGFPLALALIVIAFAMLQNYLDRKDPKLALAPVRPEVMRFE
jgi:hypothetical protein